MIEWKKQIPNKPGYWMRVNAGHRVQLHHVHKAGGLRISWGWTGEEKLKLVKDIEDKLKYFWWCGPYPEPPKEALERETRNEN